MEKTLSQTLFKIWAHRSLLPLALGLSPRRPPALQRLAKDFYPLIVSNTYLNDLVKSHRVNVSCLIDSQKLQLRVLTCFHSIDVWMQNPMGLAWIHCKHFESIARNLVFSDKNQNIHVMSIVMSMSCPCHPCPNTSFNLSMYSLVYPWNVISM